MTRPRTMPDGSLVYPRRGAPPKPPSGYTPSKGDPYILELDLIPCKHRIKTPILKPCGQYRCALTCNIKDGREVNHLYCEECEDVEE